MCVCVWNLNSTTWVTSWLDEMNSYQLRYLAVTFRRLEAVGSRVPDGWRLTLYRCPLHLTVSSTPRLASHLLNEGLERWPGKRGDGNRGGPGEGMAHFCI